MYPSPNYNPVKSDAAGKPSATWGYAARRSWASRHSYGLNALHEIAPPTHWATIKLNEPLPIDEIRTFQGVISKAIEYQNRHKATSYEISPDLAISTDGRHIAIFAVPEIDDGWCIHYHALIRASNIEPVRFLNTLIGKYNRKHGRKISMEWTETPETAIGVSTYSLKPNGKKKGKKGQPDRDILLFSPGSLSRYTFTAGKYFLNYGVNQLRQERKNEWRLSRLECQVDNIVGDW